MQLLRRITIRTRLSLIVVSLLSALILLSIISLYKSHSTLYVQQQEKVKQVVEGATSVLAHFQQLEASGKITREQAQAQAKSALNSFRYDGNNYIWINDATPTMIMHPIKPTLNGKAIGHVKDPDGVEVFIEIVNIIRKDGKGYLPYKWDKSGSDTPVDKISFVQEFKPWKWIIGSGAYIDNIDAIFSSTRNTLISISLIIAVILSSFVWVIAKSITIPATEAANLMKNIAQGEGDLTQTLDENGRDEISELSYFFNLFIEKMKNSLVNITTSSEQLRDTAEQLSQTSKTNNNLVLEQNDNTTLVATAMEQMTANIREVSVNAEAAESAALGARENTNSGKQVVSKTIKQINNLSSDIDEVSHVIDFLAEESQNIGAVLDVIRSIADQTNLLALNAAIEAARAGEQGRGFAVVADEVRTLASRTGQSTEEIQQMILKLQTGAKKAVDAVHISQKTSAQTVEDAGKTDTALNEIDRFMGTVLDMNSEIARATEQQACAADEVNLRVNELAGMTDKALAMTEELASTGTELKARSDEMSDVVNNFKLG